MKVINDEKWRTFIDLASNMAYNGIAYEIKRFAQRNFLVGKSLASPCIKMLTHHDGEQAAVQHHR